MKHLTVDEIVQFVSMTELTAESVNFSVAVNGHIRKCAKCLELVKSFQMVYDELSRLSMGFDDLKCQPVIDSAEIEDIKKKIEKLQDSDTFENYR